MPEISLTPKQHKLLVETLEYFDPKILQRGTALYGDGAVQRLFWAVPEKSLQAEVQGGTQYTVVLSFNRHAVEALCTCPYEFDCKHAAAAILHLCANAEIAAAAPKKTKAAAAPRPAAAQPASHSWAGRIAAQLGKPLPVTAVKCLQQMEPWWLNKQRHVAQQDLFKLCGRQTYWGYGQVQLWPAEHPPADETEFFAYLAHALRTCELSLPSALADLVDRTVQQRLLAQWERLRQIEQWRQRLGSWQEPQALLAAEAPELRLMLHAAGATVQVRHPGEADFSKATQKLLKQLWGGSIHSGSGPQNLLSAGSNLVLKAGLLQYGELRSDIPPLADSLVKSFAQLIASPELLQTHVVSPLDEPLQLSDDALHWDLQPPAAGGDYALRLLDDDGQTPPPPLAVVPGFPLRYVTPAVVHTVNYWPFGKDSVQWPVQIPAAALETKEGVSALAKLGVAVPQRLEGRVEHERRADDDDGAEPKVEAAERLHARALKVGRDGGEVRVDDEEGHVDEVVRPPAHVERLRPVARLEHELALHDEEEPRVHGRAQHVQVARAVRAVHRGGDGDDDAAGDEAVEHRRRHLGRVEVHVGPPRHVELGRARDGLRAHVLVERANKDDREEEDDVVA